MIVGPFSDAGGAVFERPAKACELPHLEEGYCQIRRLTSDTTQLVKIRVACAEPFGELSGPIWDQEVFRKIRSVRYRGPDISVTGIPNPLSMRE